MTTREEWAVKVEKLLRLAERAGTPAEAELAYERAQDIMTKWAIDEAMLAGTSTVEKIVHENFGIKKTYFNEDMTGMNMIAAVNDVKLLLRTPSQWGAKSGVTLIGFEGDVSRTIMLFSSVQLQVARDARRAQRDAQEYGWSRRDEWIFRCSFRDGFYLSVVQRLRARKATVVQEETESRGTGVELVLRSRALEVQQHYDDLAQQRPYRGGGTDDFNDDGWAAGRDAGERADLNDPRIKSGGKRALAG